MVKHECEGVGACFIDESILQEQVGTEEAKINVVHKFSYGILVKHRKLEAKFGQSLSLVLPFSCRRGKSLIKVTIRASFLKLAKQIVQGR